MPYLYGRPWTRQELTQYVGHLDQVAGIKLMEAADGVEKGVRVFDVWTGSGLAFQVLADRALDVSTCAFNGYSLAWRSATGDVHPAYYDPRGLEWLRSFPGGLLATCGLDYFGAPSVDEGQEFGIHGRIGNLPARYLSYRAFWQGDEYELEIAGEVRQTRVFGENLVLRRRISTRLGANWLRINDTVVNEGFAPQPHMILYHFNLGFPLLNAGSRLHVAVERTEARDQWAEPGLNAWDSFHPPAQGFHEQVFRHTPKADANNRVQVELRNPAPTPGLRLSYDKTYLPYLFQWKMLGQGIYVLGVEPGNSSAIEGRAVARQRNDLPHLQPGETRDYQLEIEVLPAE